MIFLGTVLWMYGPIKEVTRAEEVGFIKYN